KDNPFYFIGRAGLRCAEDFFKPAMNKFFSGRGSKLRAKQTFRCRDDERLDELALHLASQHVKILGGSGEITNLNMVLGPCLQKALQPRARMLGALPLVAVRQQEHDSAGPLPFRFCRDDELIDDRLRAIGEITELRFPEAEHFWVVERVTVIKPKHRGF